MATKTGYIYINNNPFTRRADNPSYSNTTYEYVRIKFDYDPEDTRFCILKQKKTVTYGGKTYEGYNYLLMGKDSKTITVNSKTAIVRLSEPQTIKSDGNWGGYPEDLFSLLSKENEYTVNWNLGTQGSTATTGSINVFDGYQTAYVSTYNETSRTVNRTALPVGGQLLTTNGRGTINLTSIPNFTINSCFGFCDFLSNNANWRYNNTNGENVSFYNLGYPVDLLSVVACSKSADDDYVPSQISVLNFANVWKQYTESGQNQIPYRADGATNYYGFDGMPLLLNIDIFVDDGDGEGETSARRYVETGEKDPDYWQSQEADEDGRPKKHTPPARPGGNDTDNMDSTEPTSHTVEQDNIAVAGQNFYYVSSTEFNSFIRWFWQDLPGIMSNDFESITYNAFTGAYGNLANYIVSCRRYHVPSKFYASGMINNNIILGRYVSGTVSNRIQSGPLAPEPVGNISIPEVFNTFADYPPFVSVSLYLPFVGVTPLDPGLVMNREIFVTAAIDLYSGEINYIVETNSVKDRLVDPVGKTYLFSRSGKCGVDIPLILADALGDATRLTQSLGSGLIGGAIGALTGGAAGAVGGIVNGASDIITGGIISPPQSIQSNSGGNSAYYDPARCALLIQRTDFKEYSVENPGNYWNKGNGFVCHEVHTFNSCDNPAGIWCQVGTIRGLEFGRATYEEVNDIKELLQEGVYLSDD